MSDRIPAADEAALEGGDRPDPAARAVARTAVVLATVVLLFIAASIVTSPLRVNHDCAVNLQIGCLLLEGQRPYVDLIELNPPLIMYLSALPAAVSSLSGLPLIPVFHVLVFALLVWSTRTLYRFGRGIVPGTVDGAMLAFVWAVYGARVWRGNDFGQREHLLVLLLLPHLLLRWRRGWGLGNSAVGAFAIGLAAGIGVCLKPYFLLFPLAAELYLVLVGRTRRLWTAENLGLVAFGAAYGLHFVLLPMEMRAGFFGRIVPLVWNGYQVYVDQRHWPFAPEVLRLGALFAAAILARPLLSGASADFAGYVAALGLASVGCFFAQRHGFSYHLIPGRAFAVLLLTSATAQIWHYFSEGGQRRWRLPVGALIVAGGLVLTLAAVEPWRDGFPARVPDDPNLLAQLRGATRPGDEVLVLSTGVGPAYPALLQLGLRPGSRYLWFFPLPMLYGDARARGAGGAVFHRLDQMPAEEHRLLAELAEDIRLRHPPLILVHTGDACYACPAGFDLLDYLAHTGILQGEMSAYRRIGTFSAKLSGAPDMQLAVFAPS